MCDFSIDWVGECRKPNEPDERFCREHLGLKCASCGNQATHTCGETMGPLTCGAPLCDECEHEIAEDGTNGWNMKHCKKSEQKFEPWYARNKQEEHS